MENVTEDVIERCLIKGVLAISPHALVIKFKPYRVGWPDRNVYWPNGIHDLVELKRPKGGRYEPLQLRTHATLRKLGHSVFVLLTKEDVYKYLKRRAH